MILISRGVSGLATLNRRRVWAITRKELREYRRNRSVIVAIAIYPIVFLVQPMIAIFTSSAAAAGYLQHSNELLYLLGIPILVPTTLAAHAITGERQQGSLEPVLTTPIRREELILGKALAAMLPSIAIAYLVYAVFLVAAGVSRSQQSRRRSTRARAHRPGRLYAAARRRHDVDRARDLDADE